MNRDLIESARSLVSQNPATVFPETVDSIVDSTIIEQSTTILSDEKDKFISTTAQLSFATTLASSPNSSNIFFENLPQRLKSATDENLSLKASIQTENSLLEGNLKDISVLATNVAQVTDRLHQLRSSIQQSVGVSSSQGSTPAASIVIGATAITTVSQAQELLTSLQSSISMNQEKSRIALSELQSCNAIATSLRQNLKEMEMRMENSSSEKVPIMDAAASQSEVERTMFAAATYDAMLKTMESLQ
jgi:hypothetical protein